MVVGDTRGYDFEKIERAIRLIVKGARFVATNVDLTGPSEHGIQPACGAACRPSSSPPAASPTSWASPTP